MAPVQWFSRALWPHFAASLPAAQMPRPAPASWLCSNMYTTEMQYRQQLRLTSKGIPQEAGKVSQRPPSEIPQQVEQFVAGCRHAGVSLHLAPCQSLAVSMQEGRYWGLAMPSCASSRHQAICCTPLAETFSPDGVALHSQKCNGKIKTVHDRLLCEAPKTYSKT